MTWVRLEDHMDEHPKIAALSDAAFRLWVNALCYANRSLTDGFIPTNMLARLYGGAKAKTLAAELVRHSLWRIVDGGWEVHDYHVYQPSKAGVESTRLVRAEAGRQGGLARSANAKEANAKESASKVLANSQTNAKQNSTPVPSPVPDPVPLGGAAQESAPSLSDQSKAEEENGSLNAIPPVVHPSSSSYWNSFRQAQFQMTCGLFADELGVTSYPPDPDLVATARSDWKAMIGERLDGKACDFFARAIKSAGQKQIVSGIPPQDYMTILEPALRKR